MVTCSASPAMRPSVTSLLQWMTEFQLTGLSPCISSRPATLRTTPRRSSTRSPSTMVPPLSWMRTSSSIRQADPMRRRFSLHGWKLTRTPWPSATSSAMSRSMLALFHAAAARIRAMKAARRSAAPAGSPRVATPRTATTARLALPRNMVSHPPSVPGHHNAGVRPHPLKVARLALPPALLAATVRPRASAGQRAVTGVTLLASWMASYRRYRTRGIEATERERELLRTATLETFSRHYNECVPTLEEELDIWGEYHAHRHEMRYDLVADMVRSLVPAHGAVLDVGCGAALVADKLGDLPLGYVGLDYGGHHIEFAAEKLRTGPPLTIRRRFVRGDGEHLPFRDGQFDVVVMSEVIEHLLRPELAVWEIARVLKPGGVLVMTTNNASEMPLRSPVSDPFSWLEKALGFKRDEIISHRPWVWPWPVAREILPEGAPDIYLPHTWHKQAETSRMFAAAGMETIHASSFEFPPPQSKTARWLNEQGDAGKRIVDVVEAGCTRIPLVKRLGCHVFMVARRTPGGLPEPPPGIWPGPFSEPGAAQSTSVR